MKRLFSVLAATLALAPLAASAAQAPKQGGAWQTARHLHRGVNVLGYDPIWQDGGKQRFQWRYFKTIRRGGFDFVRVVLQSFSHMDAQNRLDPRWLATLDRIVAEANKAGLSVILDEHDFDKCSSDPDACEPKLVAFWSQIAERYRGAPDTVLFELLNEPHGKLDADRWNTFLARLVPLVRTTNPRRTLVIGPTQWNSADKLSTLKLPDDDRNILVTFHSYEPMRFTHQGAPWTPEFAKLHDIPFTTLDVAALRTRFDQVADWSRANDRPVLLGEFGAFDKSRVPMADRVRYTQTVRTLAEERGLSWAYWQFDADFVVYDIDHDRWVEPLRRALTAGCWRQVLAIRRRRRLTAGHPARGHRSGGRLAPRLNICRGGPTPRSVIFVQCVPTFRVPHERQRPQRCRSERRVDRPSRRRS